VEVVGTEYADLKCRRCSAESATRETQSRCRKCGPDEFADNSKLEYACKPCPAHSWAPAGSIGATACLPRKPCRDGAEDLVQHSGKCHACAAAGAAFACRTVNYTFADPHCDETLPGAATSRSPALRTRDMPCPGKCPGVGGSLTTLCNTHAV
jgi:hypothetical protein